LKNQKAKLTQQQEEETQELYIEEEIEVEAEEEVEQQDEEVEEEIDEEAENERLRVLEEKRRLEEDVRQKLHQKSEFTKKFNVHKKEEVTHNSKYFTRVANVTHVNTEIFEQDYEKKLAKGGEDDFGRLGFERLGGTQGREFRKQKTKMKNRELQGGRITFQNNLIDL